MASKSVTIPDLKEILTTGMQFGHSTSRWNPKMSSYIYGAKEGVHIIDIVRSREMLTEAAEVVQKAAEKGEVLFVGTKRQAADMVRDKAMEAGGHFVTQRWAGGVFTNFDVIKKSLRRLQELERLFEEGVEGRTKFEVSRMKDEWQKLNRLYAGVKLMEKLPTVMIVIDPKYDKVAVKEARRMHIPIVGLVDTNTDPDMVDYIVPGNDDALRSIELFIKVMSDAAKAGNAGKGVEYKLKDYTDVEVKIVRKEEEDLQAEIEAQAEQDAVKVVKQSKVKAKTSGKGILEAVKDEADAKKKSKKSTKKK